MKSAHVVLVLPPLTVFTLAYTLFHGAIFYACIIALLSTFVFCDAWYFLHMVVHWCKNMYEDVQYVELMEKNIRHGRVLLNDIDRMGHYTNARYLRECGFARRDFWRVRQEIARTVNGEINVFML